MRGVTHGGAHIARKDVRDGKCLVDDFEKEATMAGLKRDFDACLILLDDLAEGNDVAPGKFWWLRDDDRSGKCVHAGEFELKVKRLRCYGVYEEGVYYLMFNGHIKTSRGTKKKAANNQIPAIRRFRKIVTEWMADRNNNHD